MSVGDTSRFPEPIRRLREAGVAIWLDDLSRAKLTSGELAGLIKDFGVVGVTTNPTIFAKALHGPQYTDQLRILAGYGLLVDTAIERVTTDDVRAAADILRPIHEATGGRDGRVSIEVDPRLAHDADATVTAAQRLWSTVDRPNVFVKIPATAQGIPAIRRSLARGISINVTLIFSLARYAQVIEACHAGMGAALAAGRDVTAIRSVASFFVSRVDTAVDHELDAIGTPAALRLRGRAGIANARLAYDMFDRSLKSPGWRVLAEAGAHPQRPLWASTGVKNPAYRDTMYVEELVTDGVVNTMPTDTLRAVADHGAVRGDTVRPAVADARETLAALEAVGVRLGDITTRLEAEGVRAFEESWTGLTEAAAGRMRRARAS